MRLGGDVMSGKTKALSKTNSGLPSIIHVHGRRWFEKVNGNTYHSVTFYVDGRHTFTSDVLYGYGDHYLQTAKEYLEQAGLLPGLDHYSSTGSTEQLWRYCERVGIRFTHDVDDVARRRDLTPGRAIHKL